MCAKLLGLEHSNHSSDELWGKNVFNSTFPVGFANYLWKSNPPMKAKYVTVDRNFDIVIDEISIEKLFNAEGLSPEDLHFSFEDVFFPYEKYIEGGFGENKDSRRDKKIDLVVKRYDENLHPDEYENLRALEIKMTVVPDNSTIRSSGDPGSEIVIRPTTTLYAALGLLDQCKIARQFKEIEESLHDIYAALSRDDGWKNNQVLLNHASQMKSVTSQICKKFYNKQIPLLLQPIWKTNGEDHELDFSHALDLVVWSNLAYVKLFLSKVPDDATTGTTATRATRCLSKFIQYTYQSSSKESRRISLHDIRVTEGRQSDKEFAVNGAGTREFLKAKKKTGGYNDTYLNPRFPRKIIRSIILEDGQRNLKPERRFDQSIYIMDKTGLYESDDF